MEIPIIIDFQPRTKGRTHVLLFHKNNKKLAGAKIFIRTDKFGETRKSIQTKLAHEFGHIVAELFHPIKSSSACEEFNEEVVAWEKARDMEVELDSETIKRSLLEYLKNSGLSQRDVEREIRIFNGEE